MTAPDRHTSRDQLTVTPTLLRAAPLLADLGERHLQGIARIGQLRRYDAGAVIFREGDPGDALHVIAQGAVKVVRTARDGDEILLARLGAGEVLGEIAILDGGDRTATAIAVEPSVHVVIPGESFRAWLVGEPAAAPALLRTLARRLRRADEVLADVALLPLPQRLAKLLLNLASESADGSARSTQLDLAARLGVTREAVNKCLRRFAEAGLIRITRGRCEVLATYRLALLAEGEGTEGP